MDERGKHRPLELEERYLRDRVVPLVSVIDDFIADRVIGYMQGLAHQDGRTGIQLLVKSPGGAVDASFRIIEEMDRLKVPVATYCVVQAAGTAAAILAHGERGSRYCLNGSRVMLTTTWTASADLQQRARAATAKLVGLLSRDTGQPQERVEADARQQRAFDAHEARAYGLVDRVRESLAAPRLPIKRPRRGARRAPGPGAQPTSEQ